MALPKLDQPLFTTTIRSSNRKIQFRPFQVKEEKILLIAEQSGETEDIVNAIRQILTNCIITNVKIDELAIFDMESLFLQLRSKSVGNELTFAIEDAEDGKVYELPVDLDLVEVNFKEDHTNEIALDSKYHMKLKYPTIDMVEDMLKLDRSNPDQMLRIIAKSIDSIYDDENVIDHSTYSEDELVEWIETFGQPVMRQINHFFDTIPTVEYTINYKNSLDHDRSYTLKGLRDFF